MRLRERLLCLAAICLAICVNDASAQGWSEPARGTATRAALMDALRPHAVWQLGAPVEFVVHDLRVAGGIGFSSVVAQRPGGTEIDITQTPGFLRGELMPDMMDGATLQALYVKSGDTWVAVQWALGATDVWYADPRLCPVFGAVLPEICN